MPKNKPAVKQNTTIVVYILLLLGIFYIGYLLLAPVKQTSDSIFWDAIQQNLKTSSVSKTITQVTEDTKIEEKTDMQYRAQLVARKTTTVSRQSESAQSSVTTETIGTVDNDYIRYTKLFSSYHGGLENQLNKWADDKDQQAKLPANLKDALLSTPLIFGYLPNVQRDALVTQLKDLNVYTVSDADVQIVKTTQGVVAHEMPFSVNWNQFTAVYKQYLAMIGLNDLAKTIEGPTEPTTYNFIISINPKNNHIVSLRLVEPYIVEHIYDNYDATLSIEIPTKTELTTAELQALVQEQVR